MPFHFESKVKLDNWILARTRRKIPWTHIYPIWIGKKEYAFDPTGPQIMATSKHGNLYWNRKTGVFEGDERHVKQKKLAIAHQKKQRPHATSV